MSHRACLFKPFFLLLVISVWLRVATAAADDTVMKCVGDGEHTLDLSALYWSDNSFRRSSDSFKFDLCKGNSTSCEITLKNGTNIGSTYSKFSKTSYGETMLTLTSDGGYKTYIYFSCDKSTLGKPLLLDSVNKTYYFEWKSLVACRGLDTLILPQMPCYVYNSKEQLIDLSDLTSPAGYRVPNTTTTGIRINVCGHVKGCDGSVCEEDHTVISRMSQSTELSVSGKTVTLDYSSVGPSGRNTEINFRCPENADQATPPKLTSSTDDKLVIDWYTMHACPADELTSDSCILRSPKYGVNIDLSSLSNGNQMFNVTAGEYTYKLGLCGATVPDCGSADDDPTRGHPVACQKKGTDPTFHKQLGLSKFVTLRYMDGAVSMKMSGGEKCSTDYLRDTIITFRCNQTVDGVGQPAFVSENDCTYNFDWDTPLVCTQEVRRECSFTDPQNSSLIYDFSSLTVGADATSWTTSVDKGARAFVNVCGPVGGVSTCDSTAAVCIQDSSQGSGSGINAGEASTMTFSKANDVITLTYSNGSACEGYPGHSTTIRFMCSKDDQFLGPQYRPELSTPCSHGFLWMTSAACVQTRTTNCSITDSGYTYDFSSITSTLSNDGFSFTPCASLDGVCGEGAVICDGSTVLSKSLPALELINDRMVSAKYAPEEGAKTVTVWFQCDHMAELAKIVTLTKGKSTVDIFVSTTLSCAPKPVDCKPSNSDGAVIDLTGLSGHNWKADSSDGMTYYFSLCSTLDKSKDDLQACLGEGVSACQKTTNNKFVNLGFAASNPEVTSSGAIHFHYINGKPCLHGNGTPRQTTVILTCAETEATPVMHVEDNNCNYEIWWQTPKACPPSASRSTNSSCGLIIDDIKYDLSPLKQKPFEISGDTSFKVGVCGPPIAVQEGCIGAAVCVNDGTPKFGAGNATSFSIVSGSGGGLEIHYSSFNSGGYSAIIMTACANGEDDNKIKFLYKLEKTYNFYLQTSAVCAPLESVNCTGSFEDESYDLNALTRHDTNYVSHNYNGATFYLNICHRLIASGGATNCPAGAAACMWNSTTNTYHSLGRLTEGNEMMNRVNSDAVFLTYSGGDPCPEGRNYSTFIMLSCNPKKKVVGEIEFVTGSSDKCRRDFMLETAAACPTKLGNITRESQCGSIPGFDTYPLKKQYKIESESHTYILNFCGATGEVETCDGEQHFGVCQISKYGTKEQVLAGKSTTSVSESIDDGRLTFNFTDGTVCMHDVNHSPRNVVLNMFCQLGVAQDSQPQFMRESKADCTYHIYWPRPELCKTENVLCSVTTEDGLVDLSILSDRSHDVAVINPTSLTENRMYSLSVCMPLPVDPHNQCPGAAVCEAFKNDSEKQKDLGFVGEAPRLATDGKTIELVYMTHTKCSTKPDETVKSIIRFTCGITKGMPYLDTSESDGCTYIFTWTTSAACPHTGSSSSPVTDCTVKHAATGRIMDLSPLSARSHTITDSTMNASIQICPTSSSTLAQCKSGVAICLNQNISAGLGSSVQSSSHDSNSFTLQYDDGDACPDESGKEVKRTTMIDFHCDVTEGVGSPVQHSSFLKCVTRFQWNTIHACQTDCLLEYKGEHYDFNYITGHRRPYKVTSPDGKYNFMLNICKDLPKDLPIDLSSTKLRSSVIVQKHSTTKYYTLGLTPTISPQYVSDGVILLKYYSPQSTEICDDGQTPTVLITLLCSGGFTGSPVFINETSCTFRFEWKTYVACSKVLRQEVSVVDGKFSEPVSKAVYTIQQALERSVVTEDGYYEYTLSLSKPILEEKLSPKCDNAHVCQYNETSNLQRPIGMQLGKYYYRDKELQLVIKSNDPCGRLNLYNSSTIIQFMCNKTAPSDSSPTFVREVLACRYEFRWELPSLCSPVADSASSSNALSAGGIAAIVIVVLVVVIVATGIIVYKVRHRRRWDGVYEYSGLSTDDDSTLLVSASKGHGPRFYDDDDEDLII